MGLVGGEDGGVETVLVLGDQLDRGRGPLARARAGRSRVLFVESRATIRLPGWHRQRLHLVLAGMRRLAGELEAEGVEVDYRPAPSVPAGIAAHVREYQPAQVVAAAPSSFDGRRSLTALGVRLERSEAFLCHEDDFAAFAAGRARFRMEDFYRWQRRRLGYLMDGDAPAGGRWNFDGENRAGPPRDARAWPKALRQPLDDLDREVLAGLPEGSFGAAPDGLWPTSRAEALRRLEHVVAEVLPTFGPFQDAMLAEQPFLAHSLLSPALNVGLLHPKEVAEAIEVAWRGGRVPIASAEGLLRQVIGWREYVWGRYWQWMPAYRDRNELVATRPLPPVFRGGQTAMRCVGEVLRSVAARGYAHHIQRLMVLGNLGLLAGIEPLEMARWMQRGFVDGAEWVMLPNVLGMALFADGGAMATKPYAAGGSYLNRMSDYCKGCRFDPRRRTGPDACPFTTLYWDFLDRHAERLARNPRVARQVAASRRLGDLGEVRRRAGAVLDALDAGAL